MNEAVKPQSLIFDQDRMLIDSSAGILAGFGAVWGAHTIQPGLDLDASPIGTPVEQTLALLAGSDSSFPPDRCLAGQVKVSAPRLFRFKLDR